MAGRNGTPLYKQKGWPEHMYLKDDNMNTIIPEVIPCPACGKRFTGHEEMLELVNHFRTETANKDNKLMSLRHNLLVKMHTLKIYLVCGDPFDNFDSRELFQHNLEKHQETGDISKIRGFLTQVRGYADIGVLARPTMQAYRAEVLSLAYQHIEEKMWPGGQIGNAFNRFMGYSPQAPMSKAQFKECVLTNTGLYLPCPPLLWLADEAYEKDGKHKGVMTEDEWRVLRQHYQNFYLNGDY